MVAEAIAIEILGRKRLLPSKANEVSRTIAAEVLATCGGPAHRRTPVLVSGMLPEPMELFDALERVGLEAVVTKARDLGITSPLAAVPGLVLGQSEVSLLELTAAYAAVANGGVWHAPSTVRLLTDGESRAGTSRSRSVLNPGRRVVSATTATEMQELLRAVVRSGTGRAASLGGQEGGKTGTTNDARDLLFIGYEPQRHWTIGVWLGNDDNRPTGASSAVAAALWGEIVQAAGRGSLAAGTSLR